MSFLKKTEKTVLSDEGGFLVKLRVIRKIELSWKQHHGDITAG